MPNFSSSLFENSIPSHKNSFETLGNSSIEIDTAEAFKPTNASTPKAKQKEFNNPNPTAGANNHSNKNSHLNCIIINFQSLFNKKEDLMNMIDSLKIDVIIGTETWLHPNILNSELFFRRF